MPYHGSCGITNVSEEAIQQIIQLGDEIVEAKILSHDHSHGFILKDAFSSFIGILPSFTTGYTGEGPRRFSYVLQLFKEHNIPINEYDISEKMMKRFEASALLSDDLNFIEVNKPVRPHRFHEYILEQHWKSSSAELWSSFKAIIPLSLIEPRLVDIAKNFADDPDSNLIKGFRRLEDSIRNRIASEKHGSKLMSEAFLDKDSLLSWSNIDNGEKTGRAQLFTGTFMAFRNPRAHKETKQTLELQIREFLLLNELFHLEAQAIEAPTDLK